MSAKLSGPLYIAGFSPDGSPLLGGIFKMKDQEGFPIDCSYDLCRQQRMSIDYLELLSDAWLSGVEKFDAAVGELELLGGSHVEEWRACGSAWLSTHPESGNSIDAFCRWVMESKSKVHPMLEKLLAFQNPLE